MSIQLPPTNPAPSGWGEAAPRAGASKVPAGSAPKPDAAPAPEPEPEPRRAVATVPMASVTMRFEVGSAQGGLTLRLTDAESGKVVREIRLESEAPPAVASSFRPGQIVDLRA